MSSDEFLLPIDDDDDDDDDDAGSKVAEGRTDFCVDGLVWLEEDRLLV
jgi:hypothetical protein